MLLISGQLPFPMSETDLIKKLFPGGVWLDGKLQLGIHGGHPNVDLENRTRNLNLPVRSFPGGLRDLPPKPRAAWPCGCCTHSSLTSVLMPTTGPKRGQPTEVSAIAALLPQ